MRLYAIFVVYVIPVMCAVFLVSVACGKLLKRVSSMYEEVD